MAFNGPHPILYLELTFCVHLVGDWVTFVLCGETWNWQVLVKTLRYLLRQQLVQTFERNHFQISFTLFVKGCMRSSIAANVKMNYPSRKLIFFYFLLPALIHIQCSMKVDLNGHVFKFQEEINRRMYHLVLNRGTSINYVNISDFVSIAVKSTSFKHRRVDTRNLFLCTILFSMYFSCWNICPLNPIALMPHHKMFV